MDNNDKGFGKSHPIPPGAHGRAVQLARKGTDAYSEEKSYMFMDKISSQKCDVDDILDSRFVSRITKFRPWSAATAM